MRSKKNKNKKGLVKCALLLEDFMQYKNMIYFHLFSQIVY